MLSHLVFDGVSDGSVGIGLEVVEAAARVARAAGPAASRQRIVSVTGEPVRTAAGRPLAVDGAPV
ncbi:MAG: AraC family transcriptional regulator, partial [Nannocystis sp.]